MSESQHDSVKLRISVIQKGDRGHSENKKVTWGRLIEKLSSPIKDKKYTLPEYLDLSIDKQNQLKDVGSFVGGPFTDGLRKGANLICRSIVTLDIDSATADQIDLLKAGLSSACIYEFFGSTTRKHTKKKPRWRLVFPLTRPLEIEEYAPLARCLAAMLFDTEAESMDAVDDVSYRPAQVMYWPSVCKDALFEKLHNEGKLLNPDKFLDSLGFDWRDWTNLPFSEKRGQKRPSSVKKAEDPREKSGIIGAFCRAYDVPAAIETFLPDKYEEGDPNSSKPRYTYVLGSSSNGAIVEDDGLFLYSHHGTDPCAERLVNAFDLVRIHLFGEYDEDAGEDTRATDLPSFREMVKLLRDDDAVQQEYTDFYESEEVEFDDLEDLDEEAEKPAKKKSKDKKTRDRETREHDSDHGAERTNRKSESKDRDREERSDTRPRERDDDGDGSSTEAGVPDMSILKQSRHPAPDFPVEVLGSFWADRANLWADNASAPVDYTAMAILVGGASLIGNSRWVQAKEGWKEPPVLWCSLVGRPSSNKSPAISPLASILSDLEAQWMPDYESALRDWETEKKEAGIRRKIWETQAQKIIDEGDIDSEVPTMPKDCVEPKKPERRRAHVGDVTIEKLLRIHAANPRGFLNLRDEMNAWFANMQRYTNGSDRPAWLEAYGGRPYTVDRVKDDMPISVRRFSVSMLGGVQPDRLLDLLTSADDGLQARFMFAWPDFEPKELSEGIPEDSGAFEGFKRLVELEMEEDRYGVLHPTVVPLSKKAWRHFADWANARPQEDVLVSAGLQSAFGKANGLVLRLALVLEHLWWAADFSDEFEAPDRVSLKAIKAAIRLRDTYVKPMQVRTFAHAGKTEAEKLGMLVANYILLERPSMISTQFLLKKSKIPGIYRGQAKEASMAVDYLVQAGWLTPVDKVTTTKGGRPKRDYVVDKRVFKLARKS